MRLLRIRTLFDPLIRIETRRQRLQWVGFRISGVLAFLLPSVRLRRSLRRFINANNLPLHVVHVNQVLPTIELLYVATKKDFEVLGATLEVTLNSLSNYRINKITIIVPEDHVQTLVNLLPEIDLTVEVVVESSLISQSLVHKLKESYGDRYGWVLQQILKLLFVKSSSEAGVLVVDADTALLLERNWIDSTGRQVLCPTWENHAPYYKFLEDHGIPVNPPKFTFVSHHMLFQPSVMRDILRLQGWTTTEELVDGLLNSKNAEENSPFSIDYELYAQYLFLVHPEKVILQKWANYEARSRNSSESIDDYTKRILSFSQSKYASVSFHSYLS